MSSAGEILTDAFALNVYTPENYGSDIAGPIALVPHSLDLLRYVKRLRTAFLACQKRVKRVGGSMYRMHVWDFRLIVVDAYSSPELEAIYVEASGGNAVCVPSVVIPGGDECMRVDVQRLAISEDDLLWEFGEKHCDYDLSTAAVTYEELENLFSAAERLAVHGRKRSCRNALRRKKK